MYFNMQGNFEHPTLRFYGLRTLQMLQAYKKMIKRQMKDEKISKLTVYSQLLQNYYIFAGQNSYLVNDEVGARCPKLGHPTLFYYYLNVGKWKIWSKCSLFQCYSFPLPPYLLFPRTNERGWIQIRKILRVFFVRGVPRGWGAKFVIY